MTDFRKKITDRIGVAFFLNYVMKSIDGVIVSMLASSVIDCGFEAIKLVFAASPIAQ